jgi:hypothetical protein
LEDRIDAHRIMCLVRIGFDLGHSSHIAVPLGEQREQRLVDAVQLRPDILFAGTVDWGFGQGALVPAENPALVCTSRPTISTGLLGERIAQRLLARPVHRV